MKIPAPFLRKKARIEIVPLIDIIFFLLATFVMVSISMVKNQGVLVRLPSSSTSAPQDRKTSVTVSITEHGGVYLDKEMVSVDRLKEKLVILKNARPQLAVFINGDEQVGFGKAIEVLDEIRKLGITKIAIQTRKKS